MPDPPSQNLSFDVSVLDQLACPVCLGILRLDADRLACLECGRAYPVIDGIPVLLSARAILPQS